MENVPLYVKIRRGIFWSFKIIALLLLRKMPWAVCSAMEGL